jgi:hypothetical protein
MFGWFKKQEQPVEVQPAPVVEAKVKKVRGRYKPRAPKQATPKTPSEVMDVLTLNVKDIWMSNDERRIAIKYGLTFDQFVNMRTELRSARKWGRPVGAKTKKRRGRKPKIEVGA